MGAEVPFMRPADLSDDFVANPVIAHALKWFINNGNKVESACCLYATSPFTDPEDIKKGQLLLDETKQDRFVFTAAIYSSPIQRALYLSQDSLTTHMWDPKQFNKRSQDLEPAYHDAGQFYWGRPNAWLHSENLFEGSKMLLLPRWRVQDIDTEDDWKNAELIRNTLNTNSQ